MWGCLLILCTATACGPIDYYGEVVGGHATILLKRRPVARLLKDPVTPAQLRHQLEIATELLAVATYHDFVPAFQSLLRQSGADLSLFYERCKALGKLPKPPEAVRVTGSAGPKTIHGQWPRGRFLMPAAAGPFDQRDRIPD